MEGGSWRFARDARDGCLRKNREESFSSIVSRARVTVE